MPTMVVNLYNENILFVVLDQSNQMKHSFTIEIKDIKKRQRFAPTTKVIQNKKKYNRKKIVDRGE